MLSLHNMKSERSKFFIKELDRILSKSNKLTKKDTSIIQICLIGLLIHGYTKEEIIDKYPLLKCFEILK